MKMKQVTVTSNWINETFVGNEREVSKYLKTIKERQFGILNDDTRKKYNHAHSVRGRADDVISVRETIHSLHPDIGLKIVITDANI